MADAKLERIYTIPLSKAYDYIRTRRTERAVKLLREFVARHMKVELENVRISEGVNSLLWRDSIQKPPRRIKVRVVKEEGMAKAWLLGEEEEMKKKEDARKKADEKKEAEKKAKETKPAATGAPGAGAQNAAKPAATGITAAKPATGAAQGAPSSSQPAAPVPQKSQNPKAADMHMKKFDVKKESVQPKSV